MLVLGASGVLAKWGAERCRARWHRGSNPQARTRYQQHAGGTRRGLQACWRPLPAEQAVPPSPLRGCACSAVRDRGGVDEGQPHSRQRQRQPAMGGAPTPSSPPPPAAPERHVRTSGWCRMLRARRQCRSCPRRPPTGPTLARRRCVDRAAACRDSPAAGRPGHQQLHPQRPQHARDRGEAGAGLHVRLGARAAAGNAAAARCRRLRLWGALEQACRLQAAGCIRPGETAAHGAQHACVPVPRPPAAACCPPDRCLPPCRCTLSMFARVPLAPDELYRLLVEPGECLRIFRSLKARGFQGWGILLQSKPCLRSSLFLQRRPALRWPTPCLPPDPLRSACATVASCRTTAGATGWWRWTRRAPGASCSSAAASPCGARGQGRRLLHCSRGSRLLLLGGCRRRPGGCRRRASKLGWPPALSACLQDGRGAAHARPHGEGGGGSGGLRSSLQAEALCTAGAMACSHASQDSGVLSMPFLLCPAPPRPPQISFRLAKPGFMKQAGPAGGRCLAASCLADSHPGPCCMHHPCRTPHLLCHYRRHVCASPTLTPCCAPACAAVLRHLAHQAVRQRLAGPAGQPAPPLRPAPPAGAAPGAATGAAVMRAAAAARHSPGDLHAGALPPTPW